MPRSQKGLNMQLILARHGNTFSAGDKLVWVGKQNDMPLVEKGYEQAKSLSKYLNQNNITPAAIYCSPLLRTQQFANTLIEECDFRQPIIIEESLNEIDYGDWSGLSSEEIIEEFGEEELVAWNERSVWPSHANWSNSEASLKTAIHNFYVRLTCEADQDDVTEIAAVLSELNSLTILGPSE